MDRSRRDGEKELENTENKNINFTTFNYILSIKSEMDRKKEAELSNKYPKS